MLPFETLKSLDKIPAISRDFSLEMLFHRYEGLEFNKETNECNSIDKTLIQYFTYEFKKDSKIQNIGKIFQGCQSLIDGSVMEGISTK